MIELVLLGSLVLLGLHFLTGGGTGKAPPAPVDAREDPAPAVVRPARARRPRAPRPREGSTAVDVSQEVEQAFEILHMDEDGVERSRRIARVRPETVAGDTLIHCDCAETGPMTLKNSRILSCRNLRTGRTIKDLARYCQSRPGKR